MPANVRYASNSDQISRLGEMTLSANSDRRIAANRAHIHGTQVPVEEPSTASKADVEHL
jgi:hypothetical protein